jgi:hypothetical protein
MRWKGGKERRDEPLLPDLIRRLESSRRRSSLARLPDRPSLSLLLVRLGNTRLVSVLLLPNARDRLALQLCLSDLGHRDVLLASPVVKHTRLERRGELLTRLGADELLVVGADSVSSDELLRSTVPSQGGCSLQECVGGCPLGVSSSGDVVRSVGGLGDERVSTRESVPVDFRQSEDLDGERRWTDPRSVSAPSCS